MQSNAGSIVPPVCAALAIFEGPTPDRKAGPDPMIGGCPMIGPGRGTAAAGAALNPVAAAATTAAVPTRTFSCVPALIDFHCLFADVALLTEILRLAGVFGRLAQRVGGVPYAPGDRKECGVSKRGWLLFLGMGVIWGVPYAMIRVAVRDFDPVFVAFGRTLLGALVLAPFALYSKVLWPVLRQWRWVLVYTLVEITGPWLLIGHAETRLTSSTVGLLIAAVPLIAIVITTRLGHERLDLRRALGLVIGFAGVTALVGLDIDVSNLGALAAIGVSVIGYALGPIIIDRKLADLPPIGVVTASLAIAAALYLPFALWRVPDRFPAGASWSVVGLGLLCTALAFVVFFALIGEVGPSRATVITYINPAVALLIGVSLLNEPLTAGMAIGFPLVIAGSILGTARAKDRPEVVPARA
ncbi:DMT family transporter [Nocardia tengchongensis]|uniref:DMT family transporter n=1 Tax=Nocardia tengchongensis TaxID=2055889 RepID=UPI0036977446